MQTDILGSTASTLSREAYAESERIERDIVDRAIGNVGVVVPISALSAEAFRISAKMCADSGLSVLSDRLMAIADRADALLGE